MVKLTPMMVQYKSMKAEHEDCILMFRLGDFYEMFFEDAEEASKILNITLTSRGKTEESRIPMCGVPYHSVDQYLSKLTRFGKKIAICEQTSKPDGKTIVKREVVRVVTPGTTFDDNILEGSTNNFVSAVFIKDKKIGFSYSDITTGDLNTTEIENHSQLTSHFYKIRPSECIVSPTLLNNEAFKKIINKIDFCHFFPNSFDKNGDNLIKEHFNIKSLKIFDLDNKPSASTSVAMLIEYLKDTQKNKLQNITKIKFYSTSNFMPLDAACIRNLDLFFTSSEGKREGSLISAIDRTKTAMGARLLRNFVMHPLVDKQLIEERLNYNEAFLKNSTLMREIRDKLSNLYDIERLLSRLTVGNGNARDLLALKQSLIEVIEIKRLLSLYEIFIPLSRDLIELNDLINLIDIAIHEQPPIVLTTGGLIKDNYNEELDRLRNISKKGKSYITDLQIREIKRTGISTLKVKFNKVFGYYIEVSKASSANVPEDYIRKQTLVNAERYIIPELKEYEESVLSAEDKIKELEFELFYEVKMEVVIKILEIQKLAKAVASIDVYSNFAFIAEQFNYTKPSITENGEINIEEGRHPVIEQLSDSFEFIPNDYNSSSITNFALITGPNMGGKSTYLRQTALIVLMSHIGSYVPATSATISITDRIFTRVGASDNLVRGESTFMVEMQETAYILNNATEKSLIILDEIGRGTSTYDGVSIAWAVTEFIHNEIKAHTLFATHYHELIDLAQNLERAKNLSAYVKENKESVTFLYKIIKGGINKSYGIEVAKLAGIPNTVIQKSIAILKNLEEKTGETNASPVMQYNLFDTPKVEYKTQIKYKTDPVHEDVINQLENLDLNTITPIDSLNLLQNLKNKLKD